MSSPCFLYPPPPTNSLRLYAPLPVNRNDRDHNPEGGMGWEGYSGFQVTGIIEGFFCIGKLA